MAFDRLLPRVSLRHEPRPHTLLPPVGPALRLGVLGGGQLGRMMIQEAMNWDVRVEVMDPSPEASCKHLTTRFVQADLKDADAVVAFGQGSTPSPWKSST